MSTEAVYLQAVPATLTVLLSRRVLVQPGTDTTTMLDYSLSLSANPPANSDTN